jgi:hypothetical protein
VTAPFVQQLRASRPPIVMPAAGMSGEAINFRIEASDIWDTVRVSAAASAKVFEVKRAVAQSFFPNDHVGDFVLKLRGWEILDETASLSDAGIGNGSIVLIAYRRRRAVR